MQLQVTKDRFKNALAAAVALSIAAAPAAAYDPELVVVRAGMIITATGEPIEGGVIVIEDGVITAVGPAIDYPASAEVIDARDQFVMPGIVLPATQLGLRGYSRNGVSANLSAADEVYPDAMDNSPWLEAGIVAVAYTPDGYGLPGAAASFLTADPYPEEDAGTLLDRSAYLRVTMTDTRRDKKTLRDAVTKARAEIKKVEEARKQWEEEQAKKKEAAEKAKKEAEKEDKKEPGDNGEEGDKPAPKPDKSRRGAAEEPENGGGNDDPNGDAEPDEPKEFQPPEIDPAVKPIVDLLQGGEGSLVIEIDSAKEFTHLVELLEELELIDTAHDSDSRDAEEDSSEEDTDAETKPTIRVALSNTGGTTHYVVGELAEFAAGGIVVLPAEMGGKAFTADRYNLAGELDLMGAELAFTLGSDTTYALENHRNRAAALVRAGLPREAALRALTINPATVLGLDERMGTIENGKTADLAFFDGHPLDPASRATRVVIEGETVWTRDGEDD